ncbi:MAG: 2-oxoglutarate dehydrogenase E1 component [Betaproteobacteria bacterium RIFCSPLOWO2_12_FULL_62_13]|nr:MAG: 2-oxoglutarate dehydrogenase E1 component [Betaproteobacteria bacterium RIFCSPLOWO2_12_FULL_62_13]
MANLMKEMLGNSCLFGSNAPFIEALYELYLEDPASVEPRWRGYFDELQRLDDRPRDISHAQIRERFARLARERRPGATVAAQPRLGDKQFAVLQLIAAYRFQGARHAGVDPLGRQEKPYIAELDPPYYGLTDADMGGVFNTGTLFAPREMKLKDILVFLQDTYCRTIGVEYMYITDMAQKRWVQERLETIRSMPGYDADHRKHILERLTAAETLERYMHTKYVGQKRFSLEGGETLIAQLDALLARAGKAGVQELVIGMAHRGRLNVLVNIMGKMPKDLFAEFEGKHDHHLLAGDVKYHQGFSTNVMTPGGPMHVTLAFNPSHLEIVNPVVEGSVRARQHRRRDFKGEQVLPVLIHGDASFAGQGVVQETLNLAQTRGYGTGGTIHIVVNNQIGFTTSDPRDVRSTLYCTDVAKMLEAPIFHVNGDDPEAVCLVTEIALDYRMEFDRDVVVDLVCYRRLGHNEQDEPMVTQPLMYKRIAKLPTTRKLHADKLAREAVLIETEAEEMITTYRNALDAGYHTNRTILSKYRPPFEVDWKPYFGTKWNENDDTRLPLETLKTLAARITTIPENFKLHPRVQKIIEDRRLMAQGKMPLDWGMAEHLALATLLHEGYSVRLSGEDTARGTFFHRHAVLHDQNRERWDQGTYIPLQNISPKQGDFVVIDSLLSEEAVLGFEYGYATSSPDELVIWEAQFGDFANGAQVVIDQFIASGEVKWGRMCGLTLLLPHGYEGQGPEHSSARIERYLQLCADYNMQVCIPATPVQMYYLLRRQMVRPYRKPLIILTPKSLLRHKESTSPLEEFAEDRFKPVNEDWDAKEIAPDNVQRVIFCSGKVFYDLRAGRRERGIKDLPLVRIAQLYPFPHDDFRAQIERYKNATEIVWCQEEPRNQGAWRHVQHYLLRHLLPHQKLFYAGRESSASPAAGYKSLHDEQQQALVEQALTMAGGSGPRILSQPPRPLLAGEED